MIAELGHYALMLALGLALIQGSMPIVGTRSDDPALMSIAVPTALAQFAFVALSFGVLAVAVALMLNAFRDSIVFFNSPSDVAERHIAPGTRIRLGGLVKTGSLVHSNDLKIRFDVTDGNREIAVVYQGVLPDLFREGQGVVAEGALDGSGVFAADTILAKHDETYMPKEVADALKKTGHWQDDYAKKAALPVGAGAK